MSSVQSYLFIYNIFICLICGNIFRITIITPRGDIEDR